MSPNSRPPKGAPSPPSHADVLDLYFLEHRAKLVDLAAFLDRLERAPAKARADFRETALRQALAILTDGQPERARRVLTLLSDPTNEVPESAQGTKGASGAYRPPAKGASS